MVLRGPGSHPRGASTRRRRQSLTDPRWVRSGAVKLVSRPWGAGIPNVAWMSTNSSPAFVSRTAPVIVVGAPYNGAMRFLGIDPGGKRLGLALGDDVTGLVTPLEVAPYTSRAQAASHIAEVMNVYGAEGVVIGLPINAEGSETPACRRTHALAAALEELGIAATLQGEHLTTNEARRRARSSGRKSSRPVDDIAAQVILEEFLEGRRSHGGGR